jgi:hypothetical protein
MSRSRWNKPLSWVVVGVICLGVGCGDDDPPPQEPGPCSVAEKTGCSEGLECMVGEDGKAGCFCSPSAKTGCEPGLECQPVEGGWAGCFCSVDLQSGCEGGLACQPVVDGNSGCFAPVVVAGQVFDLDTGEALEGARVVGRDVNNAAITGVSVTDAQGRYELSIPTPHNEDGSLASYEVLLRADAAGYVTFPSWPRVAVPVDVASATGDPPVLETASTSIGLLALEDPSGLGSISGRVLAGAPRGTLVVAGGSASGGGVTGIADHDGSYTVFNVPVGAVGVQGYKAGLQIGAETASVEAGQTTENVDLEFLGEATAVVSGKVEIVNPGAGSDTSIILVVDETFDENVASGEAPPGLRAGGVAGTWSIAGVPDGEYVVLAAFENDFLVRDPDTSIGGTSLVRVTVSGSAVAISESFKITGALDVVSPDKEEEVSGTPTFVWVDDSGEDHYDVVVFDAFGHLVWEKKDVPSVSGSKNVTVEYGGPPLEAGMLYQFRGTSIKNSGAPLARTEDLRGVFLYR